MMRRRRRSRSTTARRRTWGWRMMSCQVGTAHPASADLRGLLALYIPCMEVALLPPLLLLLLGSCFQHLRQWMAL